MISLLMYGSKANVPDYMVQGGRTHVTESPKNPGRFSPDGGSVVLSYDGAGRVSGVQTSRGTTQPTYDDNGNRLTVVEGAGTTSGSYDDQDRIASYGPNTYTQDRAGDLTSKTGVSGTTDYTYDELGNLSQVTLPNSQGRGDEDAESWLILRRAPPVHAAQLSRVRAAEVTPRPRVSPRLGR